MQKTILILSLLLLPITGLADPISYEVSPKEAKVEQINQLAIIRDQAIKEAQKLEAAEKSEAIAQAQAEFWAEIDPILSQETAAESAPTLVERALAAIKSIFN